MSASRDAILQRLRSAGPFQEIDEPADPIRVVPIEDRSLEWLLARFIGAAEKLACVVHQPAGAEDAVRVILEIVDRNSPILSWDLKHVPLPGLEEALATAGIARSQEPNASARIGLTGADAALSATGSLVLSTGPGKPRAASLLPPVHIAVLQPGRILPDLESWVAKQREKGLRAFRDMSGAMVISGPSRTADIAMQLTLGMHGPKTVHVLIVD